jgi:hypothetical protein
MTAKTGRVRVEISWNRHRGAAPHGAMTSRATDATHRHMLRVIKLHPETHQSIRERLDRAGLRISMADGTDRTFGILKLLCMTAGAGQML